MFQKVASKADVKEGEILARNVNGTSLALYMVNGQLFATSDFCPHEDCELSVEGYMDGEEVECACHGSRFKIASGEVTAPPAEDPLAVYPLELRGDDIYVDLG